MDEWEKLLADRRRVVRTAELHAAGVSVSRLRAAVRTDEWVRLLHGIYGIPPFDEPWEVVVSRAALSYSGADSALTHLTRLGLAGLWVPPTEPLHVAVLRPRSVRSTTGLAIHEVRRLAIDDDSPWPDLAVVPPEHATYAAFVSATGVGDRRALLCDVIVHGVSTPARLIEAVPERMRGRRELLETCQLVDLGCHSPREIEYYLQVERAFRLPPPRRQVEIRGRGFRYRVDLLYDEARLVVEIDGRYHEDPDQRRR